MNSKEAKSRIRINEMLKESGWRFFDTDDGPANICLETNVKIENSNSKSFGDNFENVKNGYVDYLLLDDQNKPFIVLEAKKEELNPLIGKEQARKYAMSLGVKYIILSNGLISYFWNLEKGNPQIITSFPSYEFLSKNKINDSSLEKAFNMPIDEFFIATSQDPFLVRQDFWINKQTEFIKNYCIENNLRILRHYQIAAIKSIQKALKDNKTRFLFEMATGTGKTLTSAGVIKLFLRSEIANRVLFLVDRIELEKQAKKDLKKYLSKDGINVAIYKENKDDWIKADVLISTIQSFSKDDKYKKIFKPYDFDLVISDEAHRVLGASNRSVFEYFIGFKLGLTATPKNYIKGIDFSKDDPREIERRLSIDTYHIFGCDSGYPTYSYTLKNGVKDKILVNPIVVDAKTDITTKLLSEKGLIISPNDDSYDFIDTNKTNQDQVFSIKHFERKFFSESTNSLFCKIFMEHALIDPISTEIGKTIFFCVSVEHAAKITQILNDLADQYFPGKYNSDFAVQITSKVYDAQQMSINFANNNLNGQTNFLLGYDSSKTRVAVTVGMMTTGYDCQDILNIVFCRPIFSPSDFIQMKGRGTRIYNFKYNETLIKKTKFKLFDFFGVCEFFDEKFNYDEKIKINVSKKSLSKNTIEIPKDKDHVVINRSGDEISKISVTNIDLNGMVIDTKYYESFYNKIAVDPNIKIFIRNKDKMGLSNYLQNNIFNKPKEFYSLLNLEKSMNLNRHISMDELCDKIIENDKNFRNREEILNDEFNDFILLNKKDLNKYPEKLPALREIFIAYLVDTNIREAIDKKHYQQLINSQLYDSLKQIKNEKINDMPILDFIPYYVSTNKINYNYFI